MAEAETTDLIKKVRKIEIKTRGLTRQVFAGEYHSAFKGRGVTFSEVREYQYGDDTRNIDWNVTARFNHPYIKIFEEERELTVMLLVDVSGSRNFGSLSQLKKNIITELAAVLSFSAMFNNDKIGVVFFSDKIEKFIPPKKGKTHILHIIRELIEFRPENQSTNLTEPLRFITNVINKRCTGFLISDFFAPDFEDPLKIAGRKHDIVALQIFDERESEMPDVGLVKFTDPETNQIKWVDTSVRKIRDHYKSQWNEHNITLKQLFRRNGIDSTIINTSEDYVKPLINLFKRR